MTLLSFSLNHRTAPVGARELAAASLGDVCAWLGGVASSGGTPMAEALVLSTCHRFEIYALTDDEALARSAIAEACGTTREAMGGSGLGGWTVWRDVDAAIHLGRVTAGLDSLIVGEAEIAGQVRRAAVVAREAGAFGPGLERILAGALRASGRIRSETRLAHGVTSAASAGVALAARTLSTLAGRHMLVIGAGQAARTALARLARHDVASVAVASRSRHHAEGAAAIVGGAVWELGDVAPRLGSVDVVIAATFAGGFVLDADACRAAFGGDTGRLRVLVDLSVPRVIDPGAGALEQVRLVSVDDLGDIASQSARRREREVPQAELIASEEGRRAFDRLAGRRVRRSKLF
jgi:glutamyl-tRNA reductase